MKNKRRLKKPVKIALTAIITGVLATATTVTLLAVNQSSVQVENFVGKSKKVVESWVNENHIDTTKVVYTESYSDDYEVGIVTEQSLKEGEALSENETLTVTVSEGADPSVEFILPDFTTMQEEEIKEWFSMNKFFNYVIQKEYHEDKELGSFISCDHEIGSTVKRSDLITVIVCGEKETLIVPDLSSYSRSNIEAWAEANQITIEWLEEYSDAIEAGKIISISISSGDTLTQGDTIQIILSKGVESQSNTTETTSETKSSTDNRNYATDETKNSSVSSNTTGSNNESHNTGSEVDSNPSDSSTIVKPTTCPVIATFLYNNTSVGALESSLSSSGCGVSVNQLNNSETNPNNKSGIRDYSIDNGTYYVNFYVPWQ